MDQPKFKRVLLKISGDEAWWPSSPAMRAVIVSAASIMASSG